MSSIPSTQAIVAYPNKKGDFKGMIGLFSRKNGKWEQNGSFFEGVFGRNGFIDPNLKREGDGFSPAGIYKIGIAYGRQISKLGPLKIKSQEITPGLEAIDDPKSLYYNQVVDRTYVQSPDWSSSEKMDQIDLYDIAVFVQYNWPHPIPNKGSALFLHRLRSKDQGTEGCTAMEYDNLIRLVQWLDSKQEPVLIQGDNFGIDLA